MKVAVVDDNIITVRRIVSSVRQISEYSVVAEAYDGHGILHYCYNDKNVPDILIADVQMPKMDGVALTDYITEYLPSIKILAISAHLEERVLKDVFACGAKGFIWKYEFEKEIHKALDALSRNELYLDSRIEFDLTHVGSLLTKRNIEKQVSKEIKLTQNERKLIALCSSQLEYKEIGSILNKQPKTIEVTIKRINSKLGILGGKTGLFFYSLHHSMVRLAKFTRDIINI